MKALETKSESKNIKIGIVMSLLSSLITIVVSIFFTRFINSDLGVGSSQYGLYSFASSITSLLLALSFGMTSSYIRFATIAEKENGKDGLKKINGAFVIVFSISAITALILGLLVVGAFIKGIIPLDYDESKRKIIIICLCFSVFNICVNFLSYIFTLFLNFKMKFIWVRSVAIIVSILTPLTTAIAIYFNHNIVTYVIVELIVNTLALLTNLLFCKTKLNYQAKVVFNKESWHILGSIIKFSFFIFLVTLVLEFTTNTPKILLGFFENPTGDKEITVAYYQLAATLPNSISIASAAISATYVPLVNRYVANGNDESINSIFIASTKKMIIAYLFILGGFVSCGYEFVIAWQGNNYSNTMLIYVLVCILAFVSLVPSTFSIASEIQRAKNMHKFRAFVLLIGAAVNILTSIILLSIVPKIVDGGDPYYYVWQIGAVVVGFIFGNVVNVLFMSIYNQKVVKLNMLKYFKIILIYCGITVLSFGIVHILFAFVYIADINIFIQIIIRGLLYVVIFLLLLFIFDKKTIYSFAKKEDKVLSTSNNTKTIPCSIRNNFNELFIKNGEEVLIDLIANCKEYHSIFDSLFFNKIKYLHEQAGACFTIEINYSNKLKKLSNKWKSEFISNSNWIKFMFIKGKHSPYSFVDSAFIGYDYVSFVSWVVYFAGSIDSVSQKAFVSSSDSSYSISNLVKVANSNIKAVITDDIKRFASECENDYFANCEGISVLSSDSPIFVFLDVHQLDNTNFSETNRFSYSENEVVFK